jgi:hypothetical protein
MQNTDIPKCPKCGKELKWIPKGRHLCRCGEVLMTDGKDLEDIEISETSILFKDRLPSLIEFELVFAIVSVLLLLILRILYQKTWLQYEAGIMLKIFGIEPTKYTEIIGPLTAAGLISIWVIYKGVKTLRKK